MMSSGLTALIMTKNGETSWPTHVVLRAGAQQQTTQSKLHEIHVQKSRAVEDSR